MPSPLRRRSATLLSAAALAVSVTAGCGALDTTLDCVRTADAIASSVNNLQQAVSSVGDNPLQVDQALDTIDQELGKLRDTTDNADLGTAINQLDAGVASVRIAVKNGDSTPDLTPVTDAASEIAKVCTP